MNRYEALEVYMRLKRLRDVRQSRNLSQSALAARVSSTWDQPRISKIEDGASVRPETADRIAKALLCNVGDLVMPEEPTVTLKLSDLPPEILTLLAKK